MAKLLFIGGCADGEWIETEGREVWKCAGLPKHQPFIDETPSVTPETKAFEESTYTHFLLAGGIDGSSMVEAMVEDSLITQDVMNRLIAGYVPGERLSGEWSNDARDGGIRVEIGFNDIKPVLEAGCHLRPATVVFRKP